MIKMLVAILMFVPFTYAQSVDFDKGVSKDVIVHNDNYHVPPVGHIHPGFSRFTRDCAGFSFGPSDNEIMSDRVRLRSDEYETVCHTYYVPGPNGEQIPQQNCYERFVRSYNRTVQLNIKPRKLFPWERERFEVCLEGDWLTITSIQQAYKYQIKEVGYYDVLYELYPQHRIKTAPDLNGLNVKEFSYNKETKKYRFVVTDKWAEDFYKGEKTYIKIELKKDKANWFDPSLGIKELVFDAANEYVMEFSEDELVKPQQNNEDEWDNDYKSGEKLFETRGYYLKWGFKRLDSQISTDKYMDKGETERIKK